MYLYPCSTLSGWQEPERLSLWDLCPPTASSALPLIISSFISIGRDIYSRCSRGKMSGKPSAASFWACSAFIRWSEVTNSPWTVKAKRLKKYIYIWWKTIQMCSSIFVWFLSRLHGSENTRQHQQLSVLSVNTGNRVVAIGHRSQ